MRWLVLVSLLVHTPLTPLLALFGLLGWIANPPDDLPEAPPITAIPVEILEDEAAGTPPGAPAPPPAPAEPEAILPPPVKPEPKGLVRDAGAPDAAPKDAEPPDAESPDAGLADASSTTDAEAPDAAVAENDAGLADAGPWFGDGGAEPVAAVSGDGRRVVDSNANVRVLIYPEKIRSHPLAPRIGRLLGSIYQWRDFFGPAGIDPIRDVDRVLITGSQLRNSKDVVAILKLNVPPPRIRTAIDAIVRADPEHGEWLDAGLPAATAYADRAPRVFVMGSNGIVIVTPPSALENVLSHGKKLGLKASTGAEVMTAYAVTPHRVRGLPVRIPESIRWVRIWVTPNEQGGALLEALAEDESPELASEHAEELQRAVIAATTLNLGVVGDFLNIAPRRYASKIEFRSKESQIHGTATLSASQLDEILGLVEAFLVDRRPPPVRSDAGAEKPAPTPAAGSGSPRSPRSRPR